MMGDMPRDIRRMVEGTDVGGNESSEAVSQYGWREVRQEVLVWHVRFQSAVRRAYCSAVARREGRIYEQADEGKPFRWELTEYEPDVGDPHKDTRSVDGGCTHSVQRAVQYCDDAFRAMLEKEGPLRLEPLPSPCCYNCKHCRASSEVERKEARTRYGVCALGHEVIHIGKCSEWEADAQYAQEAELSEDPTD